MNMDGRTSLQLRAQSVNDRIRSSDPFPRIRDAERRVDLSRAARQLEEQRARKSRVYFNIDDEDPFDYFEDAASKHGSQMGNSENLIVPTLFRKREGELPRKDDELRSLWMTGFIDESGRSHKMKSASMNQLPKSSHKVPRQGGRLESLNKSDIREPSDLSNGSTLTRATNSLSVAQSSGLTADERAKLKEFAARVKKEQDKKKGSPESSDKTKGSRTLELGIKAYSEANRVMLQKKRRPKERPLIFSARLNDIYDHEQREHEAARIIQFHWRRGIISQNLRYVVRCAQMAATIQRFVRGMITRRWVRKWYLLRRHFTIRIQRAFRRFRSNKYLMPILKFEVKAAVKIQSVVRMRIAKVRCEEKLLNFMATIIQCSWRGCVARAYSDKLWLNKIVIPIQSWIRRFVCWRSFQRKYKKYANAATLIQKQFRSWQVTRMMSRRLFQRETNYRVETTKLLGLAEEQIGNKIARLKQNLKKKGYRELLVQTHTDFQESYRHIDSIEKDLMELQHQKEQLSPRSLQLGWRIEMRDQGVHLRQNLSASKLDFVLNKSLNLLNLNEAVEKHVREIEEYLVQEECIKYAREEV
jgi:hypothetical protein